MAEFIDLNQEADVLNISPYSPTPVITITEDAIVVDGTITPKEVSGIPEEAVISIDLLPGFEEDLPEPIYIHESCDVSTYYGDPNPDDSFKRGNLFSELTDEFQRATARQNLGIADKSTLVWGNISGNFANQTDIYAFIVNSVAGKYDSLLVEMNLKLAQWGYEIKTELEQRANIISPDFKGIPKTTLPEIYDYSGRIASTEWVTAKINESITNTLTWFTLDKEFMYYGDLPQTIVCSWNYNEAISSQKINGITLDVGARTRVFSNVDSDLLVTLEYTIGEKTYTKSITFNKLYPIYYGNSDMLNELDKTGDYSIKLNCNVNDYAYIYIPNKSTARISVDGLVGGFALLGTVQLHNLTYYAYKSANSGLGELFVNIL